MKSTKVLLVVGLRGQATVAEISAALGEDMKDSVYHCYRKGYLERDYSLTNPGAYTYYLNPEYDELEKQL